MDALLRVRLERSVAYVDNLSKKKRYRGFFANKHLQDNYAAIYKRKGEKQHQKILKPQITPVATNADKKSQFVTGIEAMPSNASKSVFNYDKDIQKIKHRTRNRFIRSKHR
jgi:hypothetical protein